MTRWPKKYTVVGLCSVVLFIAYTDRVNISVAAIAMQQDFGWSETTKGFVLSSFFIGYLLTQVVGGWLSNRIGGRRVIGFAVIAWSVLTLITPLAASLAFALLIGARIALGMGEAIAMPGMYNLLGRWTLPTERTRALAVMLTGSTLGAPIALLLTGWMVSRYGWPMAFYSFGVAGLVLVAIWFWVVDEDPPNANRSDVQKDPDEKPPVPWRRIAKQPAVWALAFNNFCVLWGVYVILAWLPSYFADAQGLSIAGSGAYSAAPWITMAVMLNIAGAIADGKIKKGVSVTLVRKSMQAFGLLGSGVCLLLMPQAQSANVALVLICLAMGCIAFCYSGFAPNPLDLSPKYADVLVGISNTFGTLPGIFGVLVTGLIVDVTGTYAAAFALIAAINVAGTVVFTVFGTGKCVID